MKPKSYTLAVVRLDKKNEESRKRKRAKGDRVPVVINIQLTSPFSGSSFAFDDGATEDEIFARVDLPKVADKEQARLQEDDAWLADSPAAREDFESFLRANGKAAD